MDRIHLFADVSVNPQLKIGFGAYLAIPETRLHTEPITEEPRLKKFTATSSTRLELETLLWALAELESGNNNPLQDKLTIYTDSQCVVGLPARRARLENREFTGKGNNTELSNAPLYRLFYQLQDRLRFKIVKLKGHSPSAAKNHLDRIFACVDKSSRKALKTHLQTVPENNP